MHEPRLWGAAVRDPRLTGGRRAGPTDLPSMRGPSAGLGTTIGAIVDALHQAPAEMGRRNPRETTFSGVPWLLSGLRVLSAAFSVYSQWGTRKTRRSELGEVGVHYADLRMSRCRASVRQMRGRVARRRAPSARAVRWCGRGRHVLGTLFQGEFAERRTPRDASTGALRTNRIGQSEVPRQARSG